MAVKKKATKKKPPVVKSGTKLLGKGIASKGASAIYDRQRRQCNAGGGKWNVITKKCSP